MTPLVACGWWSRTCGELHPIGALGPDVAAVLTSARELRTRIGAMHLDAVEFAGGSGDELSQAVAEVSAAPAGRPMALDVTDLQAAADGARGRARRRCIRRWHSRDGSLDSTLARRLAQLDRAVAAAGSSAPTPAGGLGPDGGRRQRRSRGRAGRCHGPDGSGPRSAGPLTGEIPGPGGRLDRRAFLAGAGGLGMAVGAGAAIGWERSTDAAAGAATVSDASQTDRSRSGGRTRPASARRPRTICGSWPSIW